MNRTRALVPLFTVVAAAALAGCGSKGGQATAATQPVSTQAAGGGAAASGSGTRTLPGAFGVAAAVGKTSLEVQDPQTGQTTVKFTGSTKFQQTKSATLAQVTVGSCVTVTSSTAVSGSTLAARRVAISAPVKGACTGRRGGFGAGGFGAGGFGGRGSGGPGARPTARPTVRPSGAPRHVSGATAVGKVTAVSGGGFTVRGFVRSFRAGAGPRPTASPRPTARPRPTATPATKTLTVTVTSSTTYSRTVAATHTALKVGQCIAALGKADSTGAVTATSVTISAPVNGSCFAGFGARGGAGGGAGGNAGTGSSNA